MAFKPFLCIFCEFLWAVAENFVFLEIALVPYDDAVDIVRLGSRVLHHIFKGLPVSADFLYFDINYIEFQESVPECHTFLFFTTGHRLYPGCR